MPLTIKEKREKVKEYDAVISVGYQKAKAFRNQFINNTPNPTKANRMTLFLMFMKLMPVGRKKKFF